jgi:hemolysin activation/secretion protein
LGNTLLPPLAISQVLTNVPGAFGTNVSIDRIQEVVAHLGAAYRERGFATVYVGLPQQRLTNAAVKIQVIEGRLASIAVKGNKYFSTDNVLRSMPGLVHQHDPEQPHVSGATQSGQCQSRPPDLPRN